MLGGTQSLHTNALDEAIALPSEFAARVARNTQLILAEETGITSVVDPLGGSYYVEALTADLADAAWALIDRIDAEGGMAAAIATGLPKAMIEEAAAASQSRVDRGEATIVGVNKYRLSEEADLDIRSIDNVAVRDDQVALLARIRASRDPAAVTATLDALRDGAAGTGNLLALAVDCARVRCTLGEISLAMEDVFGRYGTTPVPVKGVYGAAYAGDPRWAAVTDGIDAVERRLGHKPKLLIAKMGQDGHDRGANVIASGFADMGFDVVSGPLFQTPAETLAMALKAGVDAIGCSSLAAGHRTLIPELIGLLRDAGRGDIKVFAGGVIPAQDYEFLRAAGVSGIYGPGSNVVECAADVLRMLGHNMPPEPLSEAAE